ncbi:MAG TPA: hypothetical protein P5161_03790 [Eubacteriales bacterium]|jgi:hypothetical protein|nr:hypothetical protein [Clostridia bacterium]HRR89880.1 hypothetical protein [Eubacteriales bacterium]HRU84162.1 hypothetical protein [Eubacteriales bacterium]
MKKVIKYVALFFFYLLQFTWGLLANLLGFLVYLSKGKLNREWFKGALISRHEENWGGVSLGIFIFVNGARGEQWFLDARAHEYGHTLQNLLLGPLYLFVIGIPSVIWCNSKRFIKLREEKGVSYYEFYPEKWANAWGDRFTGHKRTDGPVK